MKASEPVQHYRCQFANLTNATMRGQAKPSYQLPCKLLPQQPAGGQPVDVEVVPLVPLVEPLVPLVVVPLVVPLVPLVVVPLEVPLVSLAASRVLVASLLGPCQRFAQPSRVTPA